MGSMIGSGIFIVPAEMSRVVGSPALLIAAWAVTALMTVIGAVSYGELAAMMPKAGGQYVYLRESLGPIWGFLYGWTLFTVIQTGTIAAVAVAFGKFLGVFFPSVSQTNWIVHVGSGNIGLSTANLVGILVVVFLTFTNTRGVKTGAAVQNVFTTTKVLALLGVIAVGAWFGSHRATEINFGAGWPNFWAGAHWGTPHVIDVGSFLGMGGGTAVVGVLTVVAVVQVGSLFSSDAWNNVTFTAGEVRNPKRNLPLSLAIGTGAVSLLYIACNFVYLHVLPMMGQSCPAIGGLFTPGTQPQLDPSYCNVFAHGIAHATQDRVATAVMESVFGGVGAKIMAGAILISTFGCVNGMVLAGARVYYAMSRDGLFFKSTGKLDSKGVPKNSLWIQCAWTCLLCLSGQYGNLLDYVILAALVFYALTILGLFVLRRTQPDAVRPYRAVGYPVLPTIYIMMAVWICVVLLRYKPQYTWPGLILVLLGVPVYMVWRRLGSGSQGTGDREVVRG